MAPLFPDFRRVRRRIRRTLCYGAKQPHNINLPLSELVVDFFNKRCPFDYMRPETSASISGRGYADPCTLVVAMVYLDRLRVNDKVWFESSDPTDLYLPALVLASKFLHDSDTYDRASNADWAEAANISNQHLNQLEWEFVQKMNWDVMVDQAEFDQWLSFFEYWVANDFVMKNGFCTYNEIVQLSSTFPLASLLQAIASFFGVPLEYYLLYLIPFIVVASYIIFVAIHHAKMELLIKKLEDTKPEALHCGQIDKSNFEFCGPLRLRSELECKVEHALMNDVSRPIEELVYDENLNEVVDIGSNVEIIEGFSGKTKSPDCLNKAKTSTLPTPEKSSKNPKTASIKADAVVKTEKSSE